MKEVTIFSQKVYQLCSQIPPGRVSTYQHLARFLGSSPRAVGQALARNPWAPQVPCHRVITTNFSLGGYQGEKENSAVVFDKKELLRKEGVIFDHEGYLLKNLREKIIFRDFRE